MNVLVLNGYHNLDSLKGVDEPDLISLGIVNADHRIKLMNAIGHFDGTTYYEASLLFSFYFYYPIFTLN